MGRPRGWMTEQTGRTPMRSPGRPSINQRAGQQAFWKCIAKGMQGEAAALACGVSQPLGPRWFREAGGMPPISLDPHSGRYLSFAEREELALLRAQHYGVREIARQLGRSPSTISRELRRNAAARCSIGPRLHSGKQNGPRSAPKRPSSPKTSDCKSMCKTGLPARSQMPRAGRFRAPMCRGRDGAMVVERTGDGVRAGALSKSVADCGSTSRMMRPCGFLTKPSTKRSMCKAVAGCDANCPPVCVPAERCGCHAPGRGNEVSSSSPLR